MIIRDAIKIRFLIYINISDNVVYSIKDFPGNYFI